MSCRQDLIDAGKLAIPRSCQICGINKCPKRPQVRTMHPIPIQAAQDIAVKHGYDQVVIIARRVGQDPYPNGEHVTTYGIDSAHCSVAARIGEFLKFKVMKWTKEEKV